MIFATVGTQLPFPRLIETLDRLAGELGLEIIAQTADERCAPTHMKASAQLPPMQFDRNFAAADRVVSHAGIGSILTAIRHQKPIILFPRLARLGEHRNEHQLATVKELRGRRGLYPATTQEELRALLVRPALDPPAADESPLRSALIQRLSAFIVER